MRLLLSIFFILTITRIYSQELNKVEYNRNKEGKVINDLAGIGIKVNSYIDSQLVKTIYFDKDSLPIKYRTHTIYKYDENKRLISAQDFVNDNKMDWEFAFREIKYSENQIELLFPNAKTELDLAEKIFEKPSKVVFHLDSTVKIIKKEYLNLKNEKVPIQEMRIVWEEFIYDSNNKLIKIKNYYGYDEPNLIWIIEFKYKPNSLKPSVRKTKMDSKERSYDEIEYFYYSKKNKDEYTISDSPKESPKYFEKNDARSIIVSSQFFAEYWDNSKAIPQITFEPEIKLIWFNH